AEGARPVPASSGGNRASAAQLQLWHKPLSLSLHLSLPLHRTAPTLAPTARYRHPPRTARPRAPPSIPTTAARSGRKPPTPRPSPRSFSQICKPSLLLILSLALSPSVPTRCGDRRLRGGLGLPESMGSRGRRTPWRRWGAKAVVRSPCHPPPLPASGASRVPRHARIDVMEQRMEDTMEEVGGRGGSGSDGPELGFWLAARSCSENFRKEAIGIYQDQG
ncbi:unnamed protein product, partial [Urochloa humidicola]